MSLTKSMIEARKNFENWRQFGIKVKRARALMSEIFTDAANLGGAASANKFIKVMNRFDHFKSDMDNLVCKNFPNESDQDVCSVFYGKTGNNP